MTRARHRSPNADRKLSTRSRCPTRAIGGTEATAQPDQHKAYGWGFDGQARIERAQALGQNPASYGYT